jgi:hypothetical protein
MLAITARPASHAPVMPPACVPGLPDAVPDLLAALQGALAVIDDYLAYTHDGDPWTEDAWLMGEMEINDYGRDGRLKAARALIAHSPDTVNS